MITVAFDSFFHMPPGQRIGRHVVSAGMRHNFGRYHPDDCYHPNGLLFLTSRLRGRYRFKLLCEPYSDASLSDADILFVANPDYPLYPNTSPYRWTPQDVDALWRFADRGGGVILLINSFLSRPDYWEENFDLERVSVLLRRLGIEWDPEFMSDPDEILPAASGCRRVGYGQGGRLRGDALPPGVAPLMRVGDDICGVEAAVGQGRIAIVGDAGVLSNGLLCFPGFDNLAFAEDLFASVTPSWCGSSPERWDCVVYRKASMATSDRGLSSAAFRSVLPEAEWIEDHHYRHLVWDEYEERGAREAVWERPPLELRPGGGRRLPLLTIDGQAPGRTVPIEVVHAGTREGGATTITASATAELDDVSWSELCGRAGELERAMGAIERVSMVVMQRTVLGPGDRPGRCSWRQGQIVYSRNPAETHYGYEILFLDRSGVIAPRG